MSEKKTFLFFRLCKKEKKKHTFYAWTVKRNSFLTYIDNKTWVWLDINKNI